MPDQESDCCHAKVELIELWCDDDSEQWDDCYICSACGKVCNIIKI